MKKIIIVAGVLLMGFISLLTGCKPDPDFDTIKTPELTFTVPQGWPAPAYNFENNVISNANFQLGRRLFFDARQIFCLLSLSVNISNV